MTRDWVVWATLRLGLVAITLGWLPWPEQVHDLAIYAAWASGPLAEGRFPDDPMWQYPPLAAPVFRLGAALPGAASGFIVVFLAFDAAIMAMLSRHAARTGATAGRTLWALAALITGPLLLARFDVVPTAFALGAVLLATSRPAASGAAAAVGAWLKVWPVLVLAGIARRDLPRALVAAVVVSAAILGVLLVSTDRPLSFLSEQSARGLQVESVAALPFLIARALGVDVAIAYQFGAHEVLAPGVEAGARVAVLATLVGLAVVAVQRLRGALDPVPAADVALATVLISVATSRVFSGQYFIWLLALAGACLGEPRTRMRPCIWALVGAGAATQLVYPWLYSALLEGTLVAVLVQTTRITLTVAATVLALLVVLRPGRDAARRSSGPVPTGQPPIGSRDPSSTSGS